MAGVTDAALALKARLKAGGTAVGAFLSLADPAVAEILAGAGYDWVWIDTEHAPWSLERLQGALMPFRHTSTVPIVRVPWNDPVHVKQALDAGSMGIVAPMVRSVAEAKALVAACRYPPRGTRGFGPRRASAWGREIERYMATADDAIFAIPQLEDVATDVEAVLDVAGIDAVAVGPNDMSGTVGALRDHAHPKVAATIDAIAAGAKRRGLPATLGITTDPKQTSALAARGFRMVLVASDVGALVRGFDTALAEARGGTVDAAAIEQAADV